MIQKISQSPVDDGFVQNPYPFYEECLASGGKVFWSDYNMISLFKHEDVSKILKDRRFGRECPEEKKQEEVQNEESSDSNKVIVEEVKEDVKEPEQQPEQKTEESVKENKIQEDKSVEDKKELEDYSEGVKRRIAKLTKKMREAERQKEAALEYAKGVKAEADKTKTRLSTMEPGYMTAMEGRVTSGLEAAAAKLAAAREAGDLKAEIEAQKQIAKLGLEEARVELMKKKAEAESKQKPVKQPTLEDAIKPKESAPDPKATEWAERNEWFGKDNAMTYTAFDLHKTLTEVEGMDPSTDEYYAEIDKRMRIDFPHKFAKSEDKVPTKPTQTVASAKRSVNPGRKTVRLTPSQVTIAKKLGVPLEEYAKQLNITKEV